MPSVVPTPVPEKAVESAPLPAAAHLCVSPRIVIQASATALVMEHFGGDGALAFVLVGITTPVPPPDGCFGRAPRVVEELEACSVPAPLFR